MTVSKGLSPELVDGSVQVFFRERHVFKTAVEWVVAAHGGPVDAHGGVDRRFNVFWLDVTLAGPAKIGGVGTGRVGRANDFAAMNACAREDDGLLQQVIAAPRRRHGTSGAPELSGHEDERRFQQAAGWEVGEEAAHSTVKRRAKRKAIVSLRVLRTIDVLVHIPIA